ncbi:CHAT domain-containing protein [Actinoplanes sp. NPDC049118]|uniref:CHAT domain-containing tetratricopeptide repeat protein n=1 Tax=Actinoplanes sp. NPDC049118 TaxID=3155769 RepID=UPI0033F979EC
MTFRSRVRALVRRSGHARDLDRRIMKLRAGVDAAAPGSTEQAELLNSLGNRLLDRHRLAGNVDDLAAAMDCYRRCQDLVPGSELATLARGNLAVALVNRYSQLGGLEDLEAAITNGRAVLAGVQAPADRARNLSNLSHALHERYYRTRHREDLDESVTSAEIAVELAPVGAPERVAAMVNLAVALLERAAATESFTDLNRAAGLYEGAAAITPPDSWLRSPVAAGLNTVRLLQLRRSEELQAAGEESRTIAELRAIADRAPAGSVTRHAAYYAIGGTLWGRYLRDEDPARLAAAIEALEAAVAASPEGAGELPRYLNALGIALSERTVVSGSAAGLAAALAAWVRALNLLDNGFGSVPMAYKLGQQSVAADLGIAERVVSAYLWFAEAVATRDGLDRMLRSAMLVAEATKSRLLTELIGRGDLPAPPGVPADRAVREREIFAELRMLDTVELVGHGRDTGLTDTGAGGRLARRAALRGELEAVWASMTAADPRAAEYVALRRGRPLSWETLAGLAQRLGPETALLSAFSTNLRTLIFVLRSGEEAPDVCSAEIDSSGWRDLLNRFDREVRSGSGRRAETWDRPLRPLLDAVCAHLDGVDRVVLAPYDAALRLPWSLLAARAGWRRGDGGALPLVTMESLGLLPFLLDRRPAARGPATVVGDPTGNLTHAEAEAVEIAAMMGVDPLLGPAATKDRVLNGLRRSPVAHIAAHALFSPGSPLDSGIVLADGVLTAREILAESITLDLLVLSGCETGVAESLGGYEFAGLSQAFLQAGVRCLVASLWRVDDPATAALMTSFYGDWRAGLDLDRCLARAVFAGRLAAGPGRADSSDAFVLSGDWSIKWPVTAPR